MLGEAAALHLRIADLTAQHRPDTAARHLNDAVTLAPEDTHTVVAALKICRRIDHPDLARGLHRRHADALRTLGETPSPDVEQLLAKITNRRRSP